MRAAPLPVSLCSLLLLFAMTPRACAQSPDPSADEPWVVYEGIKGPGQGQHIVFVTGDEEYRSEEGMPMLAQILAARYGFTCTVLFAIDPETGIIDPMLQTSIPGLHHLASADLMVLFTRFRELPDADMQHLIDYTHSGKPIIGFRTASHPFFYQRQPDSPYAIYDFRSKAEGVEGGYGRHVFGETWVNHHGGHGTESTRGLVNGLLAGHPITNGIEDIWGPTDVYGIRDLPDDAQVVVYGQTLRGMEPTSPPNLDKSLMPVAWIRHYPTPSGNTARVFFTTMGASVDLESEGLRRLVVNAVFWTLGMEEETPVRGTVDYVTPYTPTFFGFEKHKPGIKPADLALDR